MSGVAGRILREALSGERGPEKPLSGADLSRGIRPAAPRLEIDLDLYLDAPRDKTGQAATLQPGQTYRLTVAIGKHHESRGGSPWCLRKNEMVVSVACPKCPELVIRAVGISQESPNPASVCLRRSEVEEGVEVDFQVEVPVHGPRRTGDLEVACAVPTDNFSTVCLRQPVDVIGEEMPWNQEEARIWNVDPTTPVPNRVAFLYVQERHPGRLTLLGWNRKQVFAPLMELDRPDLSLASLLGERRPPDEILGRIHAFSAQRIRQLQTWLKGLFERYGEELMLVVVDPTGAELPWEMIRLKGGYLGEKAEVIRWGPLWEIDEPVGLHLEERDCRGSTATFVDSGSSYDLGEEGEALGRLGAERLHSLSEVLARLSRGVEDLGLLYLACHGAVVCPEHEAQRYQVLYSHSEPAQRIVNLDLEFFDRREVRIPVVFVNACHSGRLLGDGSETLGLPAVFLRKVADGYIGTLGPVNEVQAAAIGARILRIFRESPCGVRLPEILRRLRHDAAAALASQQLDRGAEAWRTFLFTFMYVYYGNPLLRVFLRAEDVFDRGEEQ